jgi:Xaa-Pro dipeptidase
MPISRRQFVQTSSVAAVAFGLPAASTAGQRGGQTSPAPSIAALKPFPGKAAPISVEERKSRIEEARRLMTENGMGAIVLEPGTSMSYFVDVRWGLSERPFLVVIPATGELAYVSPGFEEARAREITKFTNDVRVWQEDEDWGAVVGGILKDRGVATGKVGIEERVRFFIADGLRQAALQGCSSASTRPSHTAAPRRSS